MEEPQDKLSSASVVHRTLLLSGDFFLGGVIAVNLAKLILRLRTLGVGQVLAFRCCLSQCGSRTGDDWPWRSRCRLMFFWASSTG